MSAGRDMKGDRSVENEAAFEKFKSCAEDHA